MSFHLFANFLSFGSRVKICWKEIDFVIRHQAPVVQTLDSAIQLINGYPVDKCWQNKPRYLLDSDLSGGQCYPPFEQLGSGYLGSLRYSFRLHFHTLLGQTTCKHGDMPFFLIIFNLILTPFIKVSNNIFCKV